MIQLLTEVSDFIPNARDNLKRIEKNDDFLDGLLGDKLLKNKSIKYIDWLSFFKIEDDPNQRVEFVKFCKLNDLFLSNELKIYLLERDDMLEGVSPEADYMLWQINNDISLLIKSAANDHTDAIHALADFMDSCDGSFDELTDQIVLMKLHGGKIDERYYIKTDKDQYLRELADDWLRKSAIKGCISSKYKIASNEINRIIARCEGYLEDRKYDYRSATFGFDSAWSEILECAREGDKEAIKYLIRVADIEGMTYDKFVEYVSIRYRHRPIDIMGQ
jgi:hypothetical protein